MHVACHGHSNPCHVTSCVTDGSQSNPALTTGRPLSMIHAPDNDKMLCVACDVDLAPKGYPKTSCLYDVIVISLGLVLGSLFFFIPLWYLPPGIHYVWNCAATGMVYGIYVGAGLMQSKKMVVFNYLNFCVVGPVLVTLSFATGPGRYFASLPPGKYLVGTAWLLHALVDTFHHPSLCCSNAKKDKFALAVFHPQFCWEPIGCMGFDILFGLLIMYMGPEAPILS